MRYEIEIDGLPGKITIIPSSMGFGRPKLYYREEYMLQTGRKGSVACYRIVADTGREEELLLRQDMMGAPTLIFREQKYPLARPLLWWEWVLCLIPFLAVMPFAVFHGAVGGALGGTIGILSLMACANFVRKQKNFLLKIGYSVIDAGVSILLFHIVMRLVASLFVG